MYLLLWDITVWVSQLQSGDCKFYWLEHWGAIETRRKKSLCVEIKTAHHQTALNILSVLYEDNLSNNQEKKPGFYLHNLLFLTDNVSVPAGSGYKLANICTILMQQCLYEAYYAKGFWGSCLWGYCKGMYCIIRCTQYFVHLSPSWNTLHTPWNFPLLFISISPSLSFSMCDIVFIFLCCIWRVPRQGNSSS